MAETQGFNFFQAMMNPQFAAQQTSLQRQQALADAIMKQGDTGDDINKLANPGGLVIPYSPMQGIAKAGDKIAGAYMQKHLDDKQLSLYEGLAGKQTADQSPDGKGGAPLLPWQTNALTGQPQGVALGNALAGGNSMRFTDQEAMDEAMQPGRGKAEFEARTAGGVAEAKAGATAPFDTVTLPDGTVVPKTNIVGKGNPAATPQSAEGQAALSEMYDAKPETNVMPNSVAGVTPRVNPNSPEGAANAAQLKVEATKEGENIGDTEKTFNVVSSQLPRALKRFEEIRQAIPNASSGEGLDKSPEGQEGWKTRFHNQLDPILGRPEAKANQLIEQISSQGILPEIGPVIASTGGRGNQFMEKMASSASGIQLHLPPDAKKQAVQSVEDQYVGNMKAQAAILRAHGKAAPTDEQIDAQVAKIKKDISAPSASGNVTHVYQPGKGIVPVGGQ